ncbi:AAA family ATPase [Lentzea sp. BCCO 10_0061]|uniref:AAA family ATPase n=1 Tax=Lentzea sokolovensis TaxID=3095429 RepID=A0ABU4VB30_9PSEU|nr:AAA family ATPase [Lentzea sp. BCCO 10_0061]MDX8149007.1 AAA family ATPase [Lentzea sp. BCCO 10_0061]
MSRPALFSYEGALRVLGKYDHPWLDKTDTFLGVSILVGGAFEPDLLRLIGAKNQVTTSLSKILDGITTKLTGLKGTRRQELIEAAHTIIVVTSVFEALRDEIDADYDRFKVTDREKFRIFDADPPAKKKESSALPALTSLPVPTPSAVRGFHENLDGELNAFFLRAISEACRFVAGLAGAPARLRAASFTAAVNAGAQSKYVNHYLGLSVAVPEFYIWEMLNEHAATRATVEQELTKIRTESLELFSTLLAKLPTEPTRATRPHHAQLRTVAEKILTKPLLRSVSDTSSINAVFPTVENGFVAPAFRLAVYDELVEPASEPWWRTSTNVREDLDTFLAAHLAGPDSTERPLLVLGNPGAGKSLLMDVLAARLPSNRFAVVTVQLRKVRAQDRIQAQIEAALREVLSKRVDWGELADECDDDITPVVLLDGFDELIQASGAHQSTYLQLVQEFQELQADRGRPVAVVVTSRVLVANRAAIAAGTPMVMLEEFDDDRIDRWLDAWNTTNIQTSGFRPTKRENLGQQVELARQPLLLMMLIIYEADPSTPSLDSQNLSNAELYRRLIDSFVLRQVSEKNAVPLPREIINKRAEESWWRLGIAAFAMFNRGHQYVTAAELNQDLEVFAPSEAAQRNTLDAPVDEADRTVENFFFIHSPTLKDEDNRLNRRTYEFLHATFGEYLIADVTMKLLVQMVAARALPTANPYQRKTPPDDSLLYGLTSHQAFVKRDPIIQFAKGLFDALSTENKKTLLDVLDELIRSFHDRASSDPYPTYRPDSTSIVSRIANYSANLVCLRVLLDEATPIAIDNLFGQDLDHPLSSWRATVHLWQSGLDSEGWEKILQSITLVQTETWHITPLEYDHMISAVQAARLLGDGKLEGMVRTGEKFVYGVVSSENKEQVLLGSLASWLTRISGAGSTAKAIPFDFKLFTTIIDHLDAGVRMNPQAKSVMAAALSREASRTPRHLVERALRHLIPRSPEELNEHMVSVYELISTICAHPDLIGRGVFPTELLPRLFGSGPSEAMSSLVLAWTTVNTADVRVDYAFREFVTQVAEAAAPYVNEISEGYLPVEAFKYLARRRATEPVIDGKLISTLCEIAAAAADHVKPQIILDLIERSRSSVTTSETARLASEYLSGRTAKITAEDQERMAILRQFAQAATSHKSQEGD